MRMIGTIPTQQQAERFSDYLVTQNLENMVEETSAGDWVVWIENDDHLDRGKTELHAFLANPTDAKYDAADQAKQVREQTQKKRSRRRQMFVDVRTNWGQPKQWAAPVTIALIILTLVVSIGTNSIGLGGQPRIGVIERFTYVPLTGDTFEQYWNEHETSERSDRGIVTDFWLSRLQRGEVWRLITPIFIHWSLLHLLFNLFWLRDLGGMIETRRGSLRMLTLVLLSAVLSCLAEFLWELPAVGAFGGMSGVNYALFGYIWIKCRYEPQLGLFISKETSFIMIAWLLLCMTTLLGPVANAAHVAGLIVGAATAYLPYRYKRVRRMLK